jgi:hypothetical protein
MDLSKSEFCLGFINLYDGIKCVAWYTILQGFILQSIYIFFIFNRKMLAEMDDEGNRILPKQQFLTDMAEVDNFTY